MADDFFGFATREENVQNIEATDIPLQDDSDFITRNATTLRIATITAITVGCVLVFASLAALFIRVCIPYCRGLVNRGWRPGSKSNASDYEQIDEDLESQTSSSKFNELESAFGAETKRIKTPTLQINTSPILRIHPVAPKGLLSTPIGGRSPVTRSLHHGDIPFELPPIAPSRLTETLQIQPDIASCRCPSRSSIGSRSSMGSRNNINSSDDTGMEDIWDDRNSNIGSPVLHQNISPSVSSPSSPQLSSSEQFRNNMLGKIQPELYRYSERGEQDLPPSRCGRVWFSLVYDGAVESLTVRVIKVKQLGNRGHNNSLRDSFVKIFLLPDERISQQTKVRLRTNNPLFNESFVFQVSDSEIKTRCLRLSVYDLDKRKSTRHLLGHALVSLTDLDPTRADEVMWRDLDDIAHPGDTGNSLGDLNVSLCYNPTLDRLTVVVQEAKNLRQMDLEETSIFVRVTLTQGHNIIKTKKTVTHEGVSDPKYNESFTFKVTAKDMDKTWLSINVVTTCGKGALQKVSSTIKNAVTRGRHGEHKYGRLEIGAFMYCRGAQLLHWQDMMDHPRKAIAKWHSLSEVLPNQ